MNCKNCRANCTGAKQDREIALCLGYDPPKTNADKLRAMSDEELAEYMGDVQTWGGCPNHGAANCQEECAKCWLDWLRQEVSE